MFYLRDAHNFAVKCLITSGNEILSSFGFIIFPISSYRPCITVIKNGEQLYWIVIFKVFTRKINLADDFHPVYRFIFQNIPRDCDAVAKRMFTAGQEVEKDAAGSECVALDCSVRKFSDRIVHKLQNFGRHPIQSSFQSTLLRKCPLRTYFLDVSEIGQFHLDGCRDWDEDIIRFDVAMN